MIFQHRALKLLGFHVLQKEPKTNVGKIGLFWVYPVIPSTATGMIKNKP